MSTKPQKKESVIPDSKLKRLLAFDALDTAEKITGKDSHDDESTVWLGMALMHENGRHRKAGLQERNDSYWAMPLKEYFEVIEAEGFKQVLALPFVGKSRREPDVNETLYVFWKADEGLLLKFDTYYGKLNGGTCYFNLHVGTGVLIPVGYSGHWRDDTLIADIDAREAFRFHLQQFREVGPFLPVWKEQPWVYLTHYMDY